MVQLFNNKNKTAMTTISSPLVSPSWLSANIDNENLVVLDATIPKVGGGDASDQYEAKHIPGARFMDLKKAFSDKTTDLPQMMLTQEKFEEAARALGINKDSVIVVYDRLGIYASPRAWWMFTSMGHDQVAVLDGGLPAWVEANLATKPMLNTTYDKGNFEAVFDPSFFVDKHKVLDAIESEAHLILDARGAGRFNGTAPEPRAGLRGGHIPNSKNLPYGEVLHKGKMKSPEALKETFSKLQVDDKNMVLSCGSGLTASILALGATMAGYENLSVYDGSWSEWGMPSDLPVVNPAAE